jgi:hypothetical protein
MDDRYVRSSGHGSLCSVRQKACSHDRLTQVDDRTMVLFLQSHLGRCLKDTTKNAISKPQSVRLKKLGEDMRIVLPIIGTSHTVLM